MRTAAALVIGNELLAGKVQDTNVHCLATLLRQLGILLRRVVIVPDEEQIIADAVRALSEQHDFVFTSGGVGPTHDDRTVAAVARAFGVPVVTSPDVERMLREYYGDRFAEGHLGMALMPEGAELAASADATWPTIVMKNVWMLPGVPEVFRIKLALVRERLSGGRPFVSRAVYTKMDEGHLKPLLDSIVLAHPAVEVGSYPKWHDPAYTTKITFDALDPELVRAAADEFVEMLPEGEPQRIE